MLGTYHVTDAGGPMAVHDDPRVARLKAAYPRWAASRAPAGGVYLSPHGQPPQVTVSDPVICDDGLEWYAPTALPQLYDLARDQIPQPSADVDLRRVGRVSLPLGVGPAYAIGPRRGQPSSEYGQAVEQLWQRHQADSDAWTSDDDDHTERVIWLAAAQCYHLTWELWCALCPYDLDETSLILGAIFGLDPKAERGDGATSQPSPPAA